MIEPTHCVGLGRLPQNSCGSIVLVNCLRGQDRPRSSHSNGLGFHGQGNVHQTGLITAPIENPRDHRLLADVAFGYVLDRDSRLGGQRWPEQTKRPDLTDKRTNLERAGAILQAGQRVAPF
jgi:hypothetical protein